MRYNILHILIKKYDKLVKNNLKLLILMYFYSRSLKVITQPNNNKM